MSILKPTLLFGLAALALLAALAACSPTAALNALAPRSTHTLTEGVAYGDGPRRQLDIYRPTAAAPAAGFPVVVFFYGGSWRHGERAGYKFVGEALASRGVLTLVTDYRLYPEVRYPDFLLDCAQALAYGIVACRRARRRPEARVRDGSQRRRLQRRDAGARPTLAARHRPQAG